MVDHFIAIMVQCPDCSRPNTADLPWPFSLETLPPDIPEPEVDEFGPINSKTVTFKIFKN